MKSIIGFPLYFRTTYVGLLHTRNLAEASVLQIGDSTIIDSQGRAIALTQNYTHFHTTEPYQFYSYSAFNLPFPILQYNVECIPKFFYGPDAKITAERVRIGSVAGNSVIHIGSTCSVFKEYRVKKIRNEIEEPEEEYAFKISQLPPSITDELFTLHPLDPKL